MANTLTRLNDDIVQCERCPRLREHCIETARVKRAAYRDWDYWGRPVPNFLARSRPHRARILIVGLAPAAHGANRTGRMFTGDRSGDFLYRAMHEAGLASQPTATDADDGLELIDTVITAAAHCAPPGNKPRPDELEACAEYLDRTIESMTDLRVVVCLGQLGMTAALKAFRRRGWIRRLADFPFGHGVEHAVDGAPHLLGSYHPSQQNTFTGRLTPPMLRKVMRRARTLAENGV
ncbi:MAG: uracil-DNA glycosylase [Phycisphaeraceae bacterium]|nr:uracil-DNA glycosylase [Phycisphaeraceae bacterium]